MGLRPDLSVSRGTLQSARLPFQEEGLGDYRAERIFSDLFKWM